MLKNSFLLIFLLSLLGCNKSDCERENIKYGVYLSNLVKDDFIVLNKDGTYQHIVISMNYNKLDKWSKKGCNIYFENFSEVIDKFSEKPTDTTKKGVYSLLIDFKELISPEGAYGYKYHSDTFNSSYR